MRSRLLCRNHIDTAEQLLSYKGSLESEMQELTEQRKGLYSQSLLLFLLWQDAELIAVMEIQPTQAADFLCVF